MASINSLMGGSSSTSSIYGTRNVLSGLASGLDTESLIENAVSGYKSKITSLQQDRTKVGWQQDAYRSMIDKMVNFTQKYTSYTSGTNLLSSTFFDSAVNVKALGENASKVVASGRTNSNIILNNVTSLASAARYSTKANLTDSAAASDVFKLGEDGKVAVGQLSGTITLGYGGKNIQISFNEEDIFNDDLDAQGNVEKTGIQKMADAINKKLEEETIAFDGGTREKASERIEAVVNKDGMIEFQTVKENDGNGVWISAASTSIKEAFGITIPSGDDAKTLKSFAFDNTSDKVVKTMTMQELIEEKGFSVTVNGSTKKLTFDEGELTKLKKEKSLISALNQKLKDAGFTDVEFYDINDKSNNNGKNAAGIQLGFRTVDPDKADDITFQVTSGAAKQLHMEGGLTSYVNTNRKLSDLLNATDKQWDSWRTEVKITPDTKLTDLGNGLFKTEDGRYLEQKLDKNNEPVTDKDGNNIYYQTNSTGDEYYYDIKINGKVAATVTKDTTMDELLKRISSSDTSEVNASYSTFTGKFSFTAKDTGENSKVQFDGLMDSLFGSQLGEVGLQDVLGTAGKVQDSTMSLTIEGIGPVTHKFTKVNASIDDAVFQINKYLKNNGHSDVTVSLDEMTGELKAVKDNGDGTKTSLKVSASANDIFTTNLTNAFKEKAKELGTYSAGTDAVFTVTVNGDEMINQRSSNNTINIDGMSLTLKGEFYKKPGDTEDVEPVTFQTDADADKIVGAIKQMVNDFNAIAKEIKDAYSTMPLQNSKGKYYEPLTEEDQADMSESAVKAYEEKAKTGLLFADRDLAGLYEGLRSALSELGVSGNDATKLGITTSYSNGLTTIALDESALRAALNENPDKVKDLFTKSKSNGASSDGLMQGLKNVLDKYAATTGATKGILVEKAGSALAPTSIYQNTIQTQLNNIDKQIEKWQDKISDQIDYYTTKFTALEKMMAQMNNQSSMLMGLSGGY